MIGWPSQTPWHVAKRVKLLARGRVANADLTAAHVGDARAVGRNSQPRQAADRVFHVAVHVLNYLARFEIKDADALPGTDREPASIGGDRRVGHVIGVAEADASEAVEKAVGQWIAEGIHALAGRRADSRLLHGRNGSGLGQSGSWFFRGPDVIGDAAAEDH